MDANLLISFDPNHVGKAKEEVNAVLGDGFEFIDSNVNGIFLLKTGKDAKEVVKEAEKACKESPSKFEYTFHWVPIETWCKSDVGVMSEEMKKIDARMDAEKSWKMDLGKRNYKTDTMELIMKLTDNINKPKVDLKNPEQIVKVEIIGENAGISLLNADEYLDTQKIRKQAE
jgi:tRNA(Ser,Leu) C12 N-acetylase TAN1